MKLKNLFKSAVEHGIDSDPRGRKALEKMLKKQSEKMKKLEGRDRELFDEERTWNPYSGSRVINGTGEEDVQVLMVGIDIETERPTISAGRSWFVNAFEEENFSTAEELHIIWGAKEAFYKKLGDYFKYIGDNILK